jgi:tRNA-2-methylthio-N6-dimethylallyladenosine synthase
VPHEVKQARLVRLQALPGRAVPRAQRGDGRLPATGARDRAFGQDARELSARTANNRVVNFGGDAGLIGTYVDVTVSAALPHSLRGELSRLTPARAGPRPPEILQCLRSASTA